MDLLVVAVDTDFHLGALASRGFGHGGSHLHGRDTETVAVAEEENALALALGTLAGLDPVAPAGALPDGPDESPGATLSIGAVVLAHDLLDGLGGLVGVVEGDGGNVVVKDVGLDDAVEESAADEAELAVDGCSGTSGVGPGLSVVVRKSGVGVLEEGNSNCQRLVLFPQLLKNRLTKPVVHPEVRDEVPDEQVGEAVVLANVPESSSDDGQTDIAGKDQVLVLLLVQGAGGVEVVDATEEAVLLALALALGLPLVEVVAGNVADEVQRPTGELLSNGVDERSDGGLLGQLIELVDQLADTRGIDLPRLRNEDHVALHVAGGLVVLSVGDLPGEVRNQEGGVGNEADRVVQHLGRRE